MIKKSILILSLLMPATVQAKTLDVVATAYCACKICCGANAKGITASGLQVKVGMVAVDKRIIKLGTKVRIGNKIYLAADTGSAIKGKRIDIFCKQHTDAINFGRKKLRIEF